MPPRDRVLVFVDDLSVPILAPDDRRHLEKSLRLRVGTGIAVGDGKGSWRLANFGPDLTELGPVCSVAKPHPELVVAVAPVKGDRTDLIVQKLTELGVDRISALRTERSVVRWDEARRAKNVDRFARIAREAAMQSRNPWLPVFDQQVALDQFLDQWPGALLADPDGDQALVDRLQEYADNGSQRGEAIVVVIGPEGGFAPAELTGRETVRLPGRILRTETAALTTGVLLATVRGSSSSASGQNHPD